MFSCNLKIFFLKSCFLRFRSGRGLKQCQHKLEHHHNVCRERHNTQLVSDLCQGLAEGSFVELLTRKSLTQDQSDHTLSNEQTDYSNMKQYCDGNKEPRAFLLELSHVY